MSSGQAQNHFLTTFWACHLGKPKTVFSPPDRLGLLDFNTNPDSFPFLPSFLLPTDKYPTARPTGSPKGRPAIPDSPDSLDPPRAGLLYTTARLTGSPKVAPKSPHGRSKVAPRSLHGRSNVAPRSLQVRSKVAPRSLQCRWKYHLYDLIDVLDLVDELHLCHPLVVLEPPH